MIWQCGATVGNHCIAEATHKSHPQNREQKWLFWKFGVGAFFMCKVILKFHLSLSGCSALAGNRQQITCLWIYYRDMISFDGLACTWKNRVLLAAFWDKISMFHLSQTKPVGAQLGALWWTLLRAAASFDVTLPSERKKQSWIDWMIEIFVCCHLALA